MLLQSQRLADLDVPSQEVWPDVEIASWVPRICDFGLAKLREIDPNESRSQFGCGSPSYMRRIRSRPDKPRLERRRTSIALGRSSTRFSRGAPPSLGKNEFDETLARS